MYSGRARLCAHSDASPSWVYCKSTAGKESEPCFCLTPDTNSSECGGQKLTVGSLTDRMAESVHCRHSAIVKNQRWWRRYEGMGYNSSSAYLFGSQSFRAGSDRPWWPVRCVSLSVTSRQSSLYFLFWEMNWFFVAFQAFQSHAVSHQWMTKTLSGKKSPNSSAIWLLHFLA